MDNKLVVKFIMDFEHYIANWSSLFEMDISVRIGKCILGFRTDDFFDRIYNNDGAKWIESIWWFMIQFTLHLALILN